MEFNLIKKEQKKKETWLLNIVILKIYSIIVYVMVRVKWRIYRNLKGQNVTYMIWYIFIGSWMLIRIKKQIRDDEIHRFPTMWSITQWNKSIPSKNKLCLLNTGDQSLCIWRCDQCFMQGGDNRSVIDYRSIHRSIMRSIRLLGGSIFLS